MKVRQGQSNDYFFKCQAVWSSNTQIYATPQNLHINFVKHAKISSYSESFAAVACNFHHYEQVTVKNISISYQKQLVAAIKFWYNGVLGRNLQLDYLYPDRGEFKIPKVFSRDDI
ncbi:MAG: hypothetical protein QM610_09930 [Chitinophagaceae bacterium]